VSVFYPEALLVGYWKTISDGSRNKPWSTKSLSMNSYIELGNDVKTATWMPAGKGSVVMADSERNFPLSSVL